MQGQIGVESELGTGSLFWFELSLVQPQGAEIAAAEKSGNSCSLSPLRVLLVDDDPVNRRLLSQMIESLGHQVVAASAGHEAVTRFRESAFDLAILDWQLPDMNGGQLAATLRSLAPELARPRISLIALSASLEDTSESGQTTSSFDQWLTKPIGLAELAAALSRTNPPQRSAEEQGERWTSTLARLGGRRELLTQIANSYRAGLPDLLANLHTAASEHRAGEVARLAHLLAGQASCFSAHELASTAKSTEASAMGNSLDPSLLAQLDKQSRELATELDYWLTNNDLTLTLSNSAESTF
jgi:CheY-like chemotaxis protein